MNDRVIAVVVSFNPDASAFVKLMEALLPQVACLIVVDNASSSDITEILAPWSERNVELMQMPDNFGIAAAQNIGIERAITLGADFVLLSDQDSVPFPSMVNELLAAISADHAFPVAAVGPVAVDSRTGKASFWVVERTGIPRRLQPPTDSENLPPFISVSFLIASGTLIPVDVIKKIGAMRSNYFIDHVDTEWCFRAKAEGYMLLGVPSSRMEHRLGDEVKRIWFFGFRQVMYHSPLRDYYMFRNTLLMIRDTSMSWVWKIHFLFRLVQFAGYFLIFSEDRCLRFKRMTLGLIHGLNAVRGRFDATVNRCSFLPVSDIEPSSAKVKLHDGISP
ncbi:glycosyl transferase family 2 [mine drainage metagenome]|uniref:Glycosyl transferase family 2 n=1 Tax=mine drainage metagenome TaxID=410659 RepID=A0A1J5Q8B4_9ZZZZ